MLMLRMQKYHSFLLACENDAKHKKPLALHVDSMAAKTRRFTVQKQMPNA